MSEAYLLDEYEVPGGPHCLPIRLGEDRNKYLQLAEHASSLHSYRSAAPEAIALIDGVLPKEYDFSPSPPWLHSLADMRQYSWQIELLFYEYCYSDASTIEEAKKTVHRSFESNALKWAEKRRICPTEGWEELWEALRQARLLDKSDLQFVNRSIYLWGITILETQDFESRMALTFSLIVSLYDSIGPDLIKEIDGRMESIIELGGRVQYMFGARRHMYDGVEYLSGNDKSAQAMIIIFGASKYLEGLFKEQARIISISPEKRPLEIPVELSDYIQVIMRVCAYIEGIGPCPYPRYVSRNRGEPSSHQASQI